MIRRTHLRGMTLLEIMVAIALLAVVGAMATKGLAQVIRARDVVFSEQARWRSIAMAWARIGEDATTSVDGLPTEVPQIRWRGDRTAARWAVWSATGGVLPIQYTLRGHTLLRIQGADLARPRAAEPGVQSTAPTDLESPLLEGVRSLALSYLDDDGEWQAQWPQEGSGKVRPRAVRFAMTLDDGRDVTRIYALP